MSEKEQRIVDRYENGDRVVDIVAEAGSSSLVYDVLRRSGTKRRRRAYKPRSDERSKDREQAMFDMRADGATLREIGCAFGVSHQRVNQILGVGSGRRRGRPPKNTNHHEAAN